MAHQADDSVIETVVQLLCENGLSQMADAMRLMLNDAMRIERSQVGDIQDHAMMLLIAVYGFRSGEIRHLRLDDIDWEQEVIRVRRTKHRRIQR